MVTRKEKEIKFIYALTIIVFSAFMAVPIIRLLIESFVKSGEISLASYIDVVAGRGFSSALYNSAVVSLTAAVISTALAFFMAYSIQYTCLLYTSHK